MNDEKGLGDRVLKGISSGDSTWLEVAVALQPTGSAELGESLTGSMADALPRAPEHVLGIIARGAFATADVCNMPFFNQPDSVGEAYYAATVRALAGVQREALTAERDRCRMELDRIHRS